MGLVIWGALLFVGGAVAVFSPLMLIAVFVASFELALEGESGDVGSIILVFGTLAMMAGLPMMLVGTARLVEVPSPTDVSKYIPQPSDTDTIANAITEALEPTVVAIRDMTVAQNPEPIEEPEPVLDERVMAVARRRLLAELSNGEE